MLGYTCLALATIIAAESGWFSLGKTLAPFLIGLFAGLIPKIILWMRGRKKKKKEKSLSSLAGLEDSTQDDLRIQDSITELRMRSEADRVVVYLFHNGGHFFDGSPIKKISMAYETVKLGVSYVSYESKDIMTSHVPDLLNEILNNNTPCIFSVPDLNGGYWKHMLESKNISYCAYKKIANGPKIIGFIGLNYCGNVDDEKMNLPETADEIATLLAEYSSKTEVALTRRLGSLEI